MYNKSQSEKCLLQIKADPRFKNLMPIKQDCANGNWMGDEGEPTWKSVLDQFHFCNNEDPTVVNLVGDLALLKLFDIWNYHTSFSWEHEMYTADCSKLKLSWVPRFSKRYFSHYCQTTMSDSLCKIFGNYIRLHSKMQKLLN